MSDDSKRPRSVDLGFCPIKTLGFRRRGLFSSRESTLISQAIPRQTPGFLALSELVGQYKNGGKEWTSACSRIDPLTLCKTYPPQPPCRSRQGAAGKGVIIPAFGRALGHFWRTK